MINVEMTVREAVDLIGNTLNHPELRERMIKALETVAGDGRSTLTLHSFPQDRKISCIKAIRNGMQWGLKESKDWIEVVQGERVYSRPVTISTDEDPVNDWDYAEFGGRSHHFEAVPTRYEEFEWVGGKPNTLTAPTATVVEIAAELRAVGCVVTTS
jgi:hypothetical protein